ncbi:MAG: mechanosensitive ion channel family protein [Chthoniobacterales bacterium]
MLLFHMLLAATPAPDVPQQVDFNFGMVRERIDSWVDGATRLLPNIGVALIVLAIFYGLGLLARSMIVRQSTRRHRDNLGVVLGGFVKSAIVLLGFLLAATIVIPSLKPGDLIAGLGVSSVAIGFAFKDILQNWLAGLLILLRQPFQVNDQISVNGHEGTVERIETRATIMKTYDGQRIVVPNSEIYTNAVLVRTAHEKRRSQYDVGVGYGDGIGHACEVIKKALASVPEVERDPAPEALPWELAASWVTIRARWWTQSRRADVVHVQAAVIQAMKEALDEAGIDMPYDTQVQLFHDQTEASEGDRSQQREGWPAAKVGKTEPRWRAEKNEGQALTTKERADSSRAS